MKIQIKKISDKNLKLNKNLKKYVYNNIFYLNYIMLLILFFVEQKGREKQRMRKKIEKDKAKE